MLNEQMTNQDEITKSLQQAEVWLLEEPDVEIAKSHLLDALDEMHYQFEQLEL